ncbi:MAG: threonine synthase [Muribaculaceae bacterium]|nr:threonine synthase [Muribaculaceae bacterium]
MLYHNIKYPERKVTLKEAVLTGTGIGQGLFMPDFIPVLPRAVINNIPGMSLVEIGYIVAGTLFDKVIPLDVVNAIVRESLTYPIPLVEIEPDRYILELFHGPTHTVKDMGARFMSRVLNYIARVENNVQGAINVLVATSGDSGAAVAHGFASLPGVNVFVLYPAGKLTEMQIAQFRLHESVTPLEVRGGFDDCRRLIREALNDRSLNERMHLTSANSINIARLLPQTIIFFHAYSRLAAHTDLDRSSVVMSIPAGHLGTLTAGAIAKRMGLPVKRFISAHNANDAFGRFLNGEQFLPESDTRPTASPALDVNNPDNYGRLMDLYGRSASALRADVSGFTCSEEQTAHTISRLQQERHYNIDPHSAVAYTSLNLLQPGEKGIALATASPQRFGAMQRPSSAAKAPAPRKIARTLSALRSAIEEHNRN